MSKVVVLTAAMCALAVCETGSKSDANVTGGGGAKVDGSWVAVAQRCGGARVHFDLDSYNLKPDKGNEGGRKGLRQDGDRHAAPHARTGAGMAG